MNSVGTRNPRVSAHVSPEQSEIIENFMKNMGYNQSEAVRTAISAFFGVDSDLINELCKLAQEKKRTIGDQAAILLTDAIQNAISKRNEESSQ